MFARLGIDLPEFKERFSPHEQAVAIALAHGMIIVVATLIMLIGICEWPPWQFLVGEAAILALCLSIIGQFDDIAKFRYLKKRRSQLEKRFKEWREDGPPMVFAACFLLQFAALTPLLLETGGPIDSPFAQLALAFAVFPPILANKLETMLIALFSSIAYIAAMVMIFADVDSSPPGRGVFIAVSVLVLVATVGLAILDRWDSDQQDDAAVIGVEKEQVA